MKGRRIRKKPRRQSTREEDDLSDEPVYCVCRSSQCDSFMIACDACEEWYHGECINVTPKQAECIQKFYCQACRDEKPELQIEFKPEHSNGRQSYGSRHRSSEIASPIIGETDDYADLFSGIQSRKRSRKHSQITQPKPRRAPNAMPFRGGDSSEDEFDLDHSQFASPSSSYSQSHAMPYSHRPKYSRMTPPSYESQADPEFQHQWRRPIARSRYPPPCGECDSCKTRDNCGTCEVCRSPKFKQGRSRQYCLYKAKMCLANDSEFQQAWRRPVARGRYFQPCGECENCKTKGNCGNCDVCRSSKFKQGRTRQYCLYKAKICLANDFQRQPSKVSPNQSHLSDIDYEAQFDDFSSSSRFLPGSHKSGITIGSKMRRGDHLPGGLGPSGRHVHDRVLEPSYSRRGPNSDMNFLESPDLVTSYGMPSHRVDRNGSSRFGGHQNRQDDTEPRVVRSVGGILDNEDLLEASDVPPNYDSDEDVVLPEMRPCAGPACSKPAIRSRYCSEECQLRHESDNISRVHTTPRFSSPKEQILTPYALPYPDHLYCRHHRMHSAQLYNVDSAVNVQQGSSSISDVYSEVYPHFVSSNQSAALDYVYDPMASSTQIPTSYKRLSGTQSGGTSVSDDYFATYSQGNHVSKVSAISHARKFAGLDNLRGRTPLNPSEHMVSNRVLTLPNRRQTQQSLSTCGGGDILSPPIPLDSITPTVRPIRMYNGHLGSGSADYRVSAADGESAAAAELLTTDANDLLDVDGNSSSGIGGGSSTNAGPSSGAPAFRQGDEYYMMNENENIEINWPTSPGGVATASAGTV
uniref:PHD-type domain-containing protein n=1 Tax=Mesocestoides corti TaxID=53468 RepID=A0A5K3FN92_MESCO